jgi:hypothetical protein
MQDRLHFRMKERICKALEPIERHKKCCTGRSFPVTIAAEAWSLSLTPSSVKITHNYTTAPLCNAWHSALTSEYSTFLNTSALLTIQAVQCTWMRDDDHELRLGFRLELFRETTRKLNQSSLLSGQRFNQFLSEEESTNLPLYQYAWQRIISPTAFNRKKFK